MKENVGLAPLDIPKELFDQDPDFRGPHRVKSGLIPEERRALR
jgi:hypothetical protein